MSEEAIAGRFKGTQRREEEASMQGRQSVYTTAAAAVVLLWSAAAHADVITESFTVTLSTVGFPEEVPIATLPEFDPANGTLISVETTLDGSASFSETPGDTDPLTAEFGLKGFGTIGGEQTFPYSPPGTAITFDMVATNTDPAVLAAFTGIVNVVIDLDLTSPAAGVLDDQNPLSGAITYNYTPIAVAEPGSLALLATSLLTFGFVGFTSRWRFFG